MSPALEALFVDYSGSHQHPTNRLTHKVAIPMIVFHVVAMLDWIHLARIPGTDWPLTVAMVAYAGAVAWYLAMDLKLGVIMALLTVLAFPLGRALPGWAVIIVAVLGWTIQLAGHVVWEKKSPSFTKNLVHALVGPVFFVATLTGDWPRRSPSPT